MSKQTQFHMLLEDCKRFLEFVHGRDPVVVISWKSKSPELEEVHQPWLRGGWYCLWNQSLLPSLTRKFISASDHGPYYRVDDALPVIEFSYPEPDQETWNGKPALTQGRIWTGLEGGNTDFERWYGAIVRWIRKNFIKSQLPLRGYIGPAAYEWYNKGGILLPMLRPPETSQWLSWVEAQEQHRNIFTD